MASSYQRDILVFGASAGGIEALTKVLSALPHDLPATMFVVQHMSPAFQSRLPELISRSTPFRALYPVDGQKLVSGHIYIAPPDNQLLVRQGYVQVNRGPKENGHRPSVDTLFRSAARAYGPRVTGVVLSGFLDCGTAGLMSIKARGGLAVVQDPDEAFAAEMPRSAIKHVRVDHVCKLDEMSNLLTKLVQSAAEPAPGTLARELRELEGDEPGKRANFVCPACRGVLTEVSVGGFEQFRCHVGHVFSLKSVLSEQTDDTERALWAALRALEESAALAERMGQRSTGELQKRFAEKQETLKQQADVIREILLGADDSYALQQEQSFM